MLQMEKPKIERVSDDEVYLLDSNGNRLKRICGAKRDGIPEDFPCLEEAGAGTAHKGIGRCAVHEKIKLPDSNLNQYSRVINLDNESSRPITDLLNLLDTSPTEELTSLDSDIKLLQALISMTLKNTTEQNLTIRKANEVSKMVERLAKLKKLKIEAAKKAQLDFEVVNKLIKGIMLSIKMHVSPEAAKRIISDIITTTINPMMSSGDLSYGDVSELKKLPKKSYDELKKEVISEK